MKTIEEKALDVIRQMVADGQVSQEVAEKYFPELKESDRIRHLLIRFVKYDMPDNYSDDFSKEDCLAWIEKQGGQKPADIERLLQAEYKRGWDKALLQLPNEVDSQIWQIANNSAKTWEESFALLYATQKAYDKGRKDASKEQEAVWSREDEKMYTATIFALAGFLGNEDKLDWLKSLKVRVLPQPKQEWSEEDEINLEKAIWYVENPAPMVVKDSMLVEWLKSLKQRIGG